MRRSREIQAAFVLDGRPDPAGRAEVREADETAGRAAQVSELSVDMTERRELVVRGDLEVHCRL